MNVVESHYDDNTNDITMDEQFDGDNASVTPKNFGDPQISARNTLSLNASILPAKFKGRQFNIHSCFPPNYPGPLIIIMMASSQLMKT